MHVHCNSPCTMISLEMVRLTASRTLGTGSQLRSSKCGITSVANCSGGSALWEISREQSNANAWRRTQRLEWANSSASLISRPEERVGSPATCRTSSVTFREQNAQCSATPAEYTSTLKLTISKRNYVLYYTGHITDIDLYCRTLCAQGGQIFDIVNSRCRTLCNVPKKVRLVERQTPYHRVTPEPV